MCRKRCQGLTREISLGIRVEPPGVKIIGHRDADNLTALVLPCREDRRRRSIGRYYVLTPLYVRYSDYDAVRLLLQSVKALDQDRKMWRHRQERINGHLVSTLQAVHEDECCTPCT